MARIITVFSHNSNGSGFATLADGELIEFGGAGVVPFSAWCRAAGVSTAYVSQHPRRNSRRVAVAYHAPLQIVSTAHLTEEQVASLRTFAGQVASREQAYATGTATAGYLSYWSRLGYEVR